MSIELVSDFTKQFRASTPWRNQFREKFINLSDQAWLELLIKSIAENVIDEVVFPGFPPEELQQHVHGHGGADSLRGAMIFRNFTRYHAPQHIFRNVNSTFLDYGSGWGRITRTFMRDFLLENMYCFEPDKKLAALNRVLNPYVTVTAGEFEPPTLFKDSSFDLIVGFSIFSHLPEDLAKLWLAEFKRILRPGGCISITTWGKRFIDRIKTDKKIMNEGNSIHFYSKVVIDAAGDIDELDKKYKNGEFIYLNSGNSLKYGEAFVHLDAMRRILPDGLEILEYDSEKVQQDIFLIVKK